MDLYQWLIAAAILALVLLAIADLFWLKWLPF